MVGASRLDSGSGGPEQSQQIAVEVGPPAGRPWPAEQASRRHAVAVRAPFWPRAKPALA